MRHGCQCPSCLFAKVSYRNNGLLHSMRGCSQWSMVLPFWPWAYRSSSLSWAVELCRCALTAVILTSQVTPFSATHFPGHCFGSIPAPGSFAASAFPVPPEGGGTMVVVVCDLNHRLAISEGSIGRSSASKSCKSELHQKGFSEV